MKYVQVLQWSIKSGSIHLEMLGEDQKVHRFEVSPECAGVLAAALGTESEKLNKEGNDLQLIRPTAMQMAKTDVGEAVMIITLASGVELPLVFKPESLGRIISELQTLLQSAPDAQVRWS